MKSIGLSDVLKFVDIQESAVGTVDILRFYPCGETVLGPRLQVDGGEQAGIVACGRAAKNKPTM